MLIVLPKHLREANTPYFCVYMLNQLHWRSKKRATDFPDVHIFVYGGQHRWHSPLKVLRNLHEHDPHVGDYLQQYQTSN